MSTAVGHANWDLTAFFPEFGGPDFQSYLHDVERRVASLRDRAQVLGPLEKARLENWTTLLLDMEETAARLWHLGTYVYCRRAEDTSDETAQGAASKIDVLQSKYRQAEVPLLAGLKVASDAAFAELVAEPRLASASWYLRRLRERARKSMDAALESLAADLEVTGFQAWERLYETTAGQLEFDLRGPDGTVRKVPMSLKVSLLEDPDPAVRKAVLEGSNAAWAAHGDMAAAALNAISGHRLTVYARRGVDHFLDMACFDSGLSRKTLDTMMDAIASRREVPRRYLRRKAQVLGLPRLGFQDLSAPLPLGDPESVTWEAGTRRILDAFGRSYPALRDFAGMALERRWIESEVRPNKAPGGFCIGSIVLGETRIYMTYHGSLGDVNTLAHELGHAWHEWVVRDLRPFARDYPMTLAETASTFAETLLGDALLEDPAADDRRKAILLDRRLEEASAYLLNIPMRYLFERKVYEERARGDLGVSRLKELMGQTQAEVYGDTLDPESLDPWFWASKGHFYITGLSFYNFPYSFGYLFSLGVYARAQKEGADFLPRYENLLRLTGSASCEDVARQALGVDLERPEFWLDSLALVERDLERFEEILPRVRPT